jgi:CRISPR-associated protein Cas2
MTMSRRHFLITYDIADDKRRTRVFNTLQDHGDHAQYSVFFCQLTSIERISLESIIQGAIDNTMDQVLFVDLGKSDHDLSVRVDAVGKCYDPPVRSMIV